MLPPVRLPAIPWASWLLTARARLPTLQTLALNDMSATIEKLRDFLKRSPVRKPSLSAARPPCCNTRLGPRNAPHPCIRAPPPRVQDVPFEGDIAAFPLRKASRAAPSFLERGEETAAPPHIPPWLPALPDPHTYQSTPVYAGQHPTNAAQQL